MISNPPELVYSALVLCHTIIVLTGVGGGGERGVNKLFAEAANTEISCMHLANKKSVCRKTETQTKLFAARAAYI